MRRTLPGWTMTLVLGVVVLFANTARAQREQDERLRNAGVQAYEMDRTYVLPESEPPLLDDESLPPTGAAGRLERWPENLERKMPRRNAQLSKLGRGLENVFFGWLELPRYWGSEIRETNLFTGLIQGTLKGTWWTVGRTVIGVVEVFTFPIKHPNNYGPIIEPEFIIQDMWGEPMPIVSDFDNNASDPVIRDF